MNCSIYHATKCQYGQEYTTLLSQLHCPAYGQGTDGCSRWHEQVSSVHADGSLVVCKLLSTPAHTR